MRNFDRVSPTHTSEMIVGETVENMDSPMPTKILDVRKRV
jgi:hypothetical protein